MSTTIDERVVSMKFDNKQFEANAQTSINTLAKLKEKLNFDTTSSGFEKIQNAFNSFSTKKVEVELDNVGIKFQVLRTLAEQTTRNIANDIYNNIKGSFDSLYNSTLGQIKSGGWNRATQIDNAKFQLQGLGVAWDEISEDIDYGVKDTAYGLGECAAIAAQLVASSVKTGDNMKSALRSISGVAAMTNSTYSDIGSIYTTIAGNGKLMTDQLNRFSYRGLNAASALGEQLGKTEAEIREMVSKGKIDFQTFADAMDAAFGEHAKKGNETFEGSLSNMNSALSRIGALFAGPIRNAGIDFFNALRVKINEVKNAIVPLADAFEAFLIPMAKNVAEVIKSIDLTRFSERIDAIGNALTGKETAKFSKWVDVRNSFEAAGISADDFQETIKEVAKEHGVAIDDMLKEETSFLSTLKNGWLSGDILKESIERFGKSAKTTTKDLEEYQKVLKDIWGGKLGNGAERSKKLEEMGLEASAIQKLVNKGASYKLTLEDLTEAGIESANVTDEQSEAYKKLAEQAEKTGTPLNELLESLNKPTGVELLIQSLQNIWHNIKAIAGAFREAWNDVFKISEDGGLYNIIYNFEKLTERLLITEERANDIKTVFTAILKVFDLTITVVGKVIKVIAKLGGTVLVALAKAISVVVSALSKVIEFVSKLGSEIHNFIEEKANDFYDWFSKTQVYEVFIAIADKVASAFKTIKENASQITFASIIEAFNKLKSTITGSTWYKTLSEFFDKIKTNETVVKIIDSINKKLKEFTEAIKNIKLPEFDNISQWFIDLKNNIKEAFANSEETFNIGDLIDFNVDFSNVKFGEADKVLNPIQKIINTVKEIVLNIKESFGTGVDFVKDLNLTDRMVEFVERIVEMFNRIGNIKVDSQNSKITDLSSWLLNSTKTFTSVIWAITGMRLADVFDNLRMISEGWATAFGGSAKTKIEKTAGSIKTMAESLAIIVLSIAALAVVIHLINDPEAVKSSLEIVVVCLGAMIVAVSLLTKFEAKIKGMDFIGVAAFIVSFGATILLIAIALKKISTIEFNEQYEQNLKVFRNILIGVGALAIVIAMVGKQMAGVGAAILAIIIAVRMLSGMIFRFRLIAELMKKDPDGFRSAFELMAGMLIALVGVVKILAGSPFKSEKAYEGILTMIGIAWAMRSLVKTLGLLVAIIELSKPAALIAAIGILAAIMFGLNRFITTLNATGTPNAKAYALVLSLAVLAIVMGKLVSVLGKMEKDELIQGMVAVGLITLMLSCLMLALSQVARYGKNTLSKDSRGGVFLLLIEALAIIVILSGLAIALSRFGGDMKNAIAGAAAVGILCLALVGMMYALAGLEKISSNGISIKMVAEMVVIVIIIGILGVIVGALSNTIKDPGGAIKIAESLVILLGGLALVMLACIPLGFFAVEALAGAGALIAFLLVLAGVISLIGHFGGDQQVADMDKGIAVISKIGEAIGSFISGIGVGLTSGLPKIGQNLTDFANNIQGFIDVVGNIKSGFAGKVTGLTAGMLVLTEGAFITGIASFINEKIGINLPDIGTNLSSFAENAGTFFKEINKLNPSVAENVKGIAECIEILTKESILTGITGWIPVKESLPQLGSDLSSFMKNSSGFFGEINKIPDNAVDKAKTIIDIVTTLTSGGILNTLTTTVFSNTIAIGSFTDNLRLLAAGIRDFGDMVSGISDFGAMDSAISALNKLMRIEFPKVGFAQLFTGFTDYSIAECLGTLGEGLAAFVEKVSGISDYTVIDPALDALRSLCDFARDIPNAGGLLALFIGDNDLASFSTGISKLGLAIASFAKNTSGIAPEAYSSVETAIRIAKNMSALADTSMARGDSLSFFSEGLITLADTLTQFVAKMAEIDVESAMNTVNKIIQALGKGFETATTKDATIQQAGTNLMNQFLQGCELVKPKAIEFSQLLLVAMIEQIQLKHSEFNKAGQEVIQKFADGINSSGHKARQAGSNVAAATMQGLRSKNDETYSIGTNIIYGLINGLQDEDANKALAAASDAVANSIANKMRSALDVHSPSRVARQIGVYVGEGLILGLNDTEEAAGKAGYDVADAVGTGLSKAIESVTDFIQNGIDSTPTITPVLDLSNVEAGKKTLNTMFSRSQALAVGAVGKYEDTNGLLNDQAVSGSGTTIQYTQNNYSPKALSRSEIYRQTKNQLSSMKGALA